MFYTFGGADINVPTQRSVAVLKSLIQLQQKEMTSSKQDLLQALELGLQKPNDEALAAINLAHVHFLKKEYERILTYMKLNK